MARCVYSVSLNCSVCCLCVNVLWTTATGLSGHFSTTLIEFFPCLFLSCKAVLGQNSQRRGTARTSQFFFFCLLCMFRSQYSMYCLYVNVYTVLLPSGVNPISVKKIHNKCLISCVIMMCVLLNLKCGFLSDVFGKVEYGDVPIRNE
jgi:hypothetical protein